MTTNSFGFQGGSGSGNTPTTLNFGLFSQIRDSSPIVNTTAEGSLIGLGIGSLIVPENTFIQGDSYHLKMCGVINARGTATLTIRIHANGIDIATTGAIALDPTTTKVWELLADFTIRETGTTGVAELLTNGGFLYNKNSGLQLEGISFNNVNNTTFDTTIINVLDIVAQWNLADPLNSIYSSQTILTKTF